MSQVPPTHLNVPCCSNQHHEKMMDEGVKASTYIPIIHPEQAAKMDREERRVLFENCVRNMLTLLGEDPEREGLLKTPERVFKSFETLCSGNTLSDPKAILGEALFSSDNSQMVVIRDIEIYSLCEHHLLPVIGKCHVAYIPNGKVVGLSKIPRMVDMFAKRLQIQEQLTEQIAQAIVDTIQPEGVGVVIEARHMCMEMRGVEKVLSTTITSSLKGQFLIQETRKEFFDIINRTASNRL